MGDLFLRHGTMPGDENQRVQSARQPRPAQIRTDLLVFFTGTRP
jgi:hypothetical protein